MTTTIIEFSSDYHAVPKPIMRNLTRKIVEQKILDMLAASPVSEGDIWAFKRTLFSDSDQDWETIVGIKQDGEIFIEGNS